MQAIAYYAIITILCYTIPYHTILHYTDKLYNTIPCHTILYYTILYTIYYILYTIYYILYTIYYILYTIYYILYTIQNYMHESKPITGLPHQALPTMLYSGFRALGLSVMV